MLKETEISLENNELEDIVNSIIEIIDKKLNDMQNAIDTEELKKLLNLKKSETLLFQQFKEADKLYKKETFRL